MNSINSVGAVNTTMKAVPSAETKNETKVDLTQKPDEIELSTKEEEPPEISTARMVFKLLTDEQIAQINKSGKLPDNGKFVMNGMGSYSICNNFFDLTTGTHKLPEGFEVVKNVFGFAMVVPKGTEGALIQK